MRSHVVVPVLVVLLALPLAARPAWATGVLIGDPIPDVTLPAVDRVAQVRLRGLGDGVLVFSFFSTYCRPCRAELPTLARAVARVNKGHAGSRIKLTVIVLDDVPLSLRRQLGSDTLWLLDRRAQARDAFAPRRYPCTYLVKSLHVRNINRGFGQGYEKRVEHWLRQLTDIGPKADAPRPKPRRDR